MAGALAANLRLGARALQERVARGERPRIPEPMVMDEPESVAAFHVADPVLQLPVYRFNALAISALAIQGAQVLDLGSGSGRLLAHLAACRGDLRITGTDLADTMLDTGRSLLADEGLSGRVTLRHADMTALPADLPARIDVVTCMWALHHLPAREHLVACLREIARLRAEHGCAVWLFDFARLRRDDTLATMMGLSPGAPERLISDGIASERAAWTHDELREAAHEAGLELAHGGRERMIGHFQCAWTPGADAAVAHERLWHDEPLPGPTRAILARLRAGLPRP